MTIAELQEVVDRNGFSITYLGPSIGPGKIKKPYACSLSPVTGNQRWHRNEVTLRGLGGSYEEALEDALANLSHFLIERVDPV